MILRLKPSVPYVEKIAEDWDFKIKVSLVSVCNYY
jgi:hypothetical protein